MTYVGLLVSFVFYTKARKHGLNSLFLATSVAMSLYVSGNRLIVRYSV